jgi:hypothetical protein
MILIGYAMDIQYYPWRKLCNENNILWYNIIR